MSKIDLKKFNFLIDCQFIRFDDAGRYHWVMYQRSRTLASVERNRLCSMRGCIRCDAEMEVRESMPYCPVCLEKTKFEEEEWCREEKRAQTAKNKAESELAKKTQQGIAAVPKTWTEASIADKAARDAKKKKKKPEIRKTATLKDMLKAEEIKLTKKLEVFLTKTEKEIKTDP